MNNSIHYLAKKSANNFLKSCSEFSRKKPVNDWIDGGITISQPEYIIFIPWIPKLFDCDIPEEDGE